MRQVKGRPEEGNGAGKASYAEMIAHLERPDADRIALGEAVVVGEAVIKGEVVDVVLTTRRKLVDLTSREAEVARLIGHELGDAGIARVLGISRRTVEKHIQHVFMKWRVHTRAAVARLASLAAEGSG